MTITDLINEVKQSNGLLNNGENIILNKLKTIPEKYLKKIKLSGGCWLWTGWLAGGYGVITLKNKRITTHRYFYSHFKGEIPDLLFVCHRCDVRNCVNPKHLFVGTAQDNATDRTLKNRSARNCGEKNGMYMKKLKRLENEKLIG